MILPNGGCGQPKRGLLQLFLVYQGLSMKYMSAAPSSPTRQVWGAINSKILAVLPGPAKSLWQKATGMLTRTV